VAFLVGSAHASVPFLGFVSSSLISRFTLIHGKEIGASNNTSEEFYLDKLVLAVPAKPIPEPTSLYLMTFGLFLLKRSFIIG